MDIDREEVNKVVKKLFDDFMFYVVIGGLYRLVLLPFYAKEAFSPRRPST